jgi:hypothetical protein
MQVYMKLNTKQKIMLFWLDMLCIKDLYVRSKEMEAGNGFRTNFLGDAGCGIIYFKNRFPELFDFFYEQDMSLGVVASRRWIFTSRRWLFVDLPEQMREC